MAGIQIPQSRKKSGAESLGQALGIAETIQGLSNRQQESEYSQKRMDFDAADAERRASDAQRKSERESGIYTKSDLIDLRNKGFEIVDKPPSANPNDWTQIKSKEDNKSYYVFMPKKAEKPDTAPRDFMVKERDTLQDIYGKDVEVRKNRAIFRALDDAKLFASDKSGAGDLSLVRAFYTALEPNSVVRETEAEMAEGLAGIDQKAKNWLKKNMSGEKLGDEQRSDLLRQIASKAKVAADDQKKQIQKYKKQSELRKVPFDQLVLDEAPDIEDSLLANNKKIGGGQVGANNYFEAKSLSDKIYKNAPKGTTPFFDSERGGVPVYMTDEQIKQLGDPAAYGFKKVEKLR